MKKVMYLTLALSMGLLISGCTKVTDNASPTPAVSLEKTYHSVKDKFSIQYPGDRSVQENFTGASVLFLSPQTSGDLVRENIAIVKKSLDQDLSVDSYYAITKPSMAESISGFDEISNQTITLDTIPAKKVIYGGMLQGLGEAVYHLQRESIYLIKNKAIYMLTYTSTQDTFNDWNAQVDAMIATLKIQ